MRWTRKGYDAPSKQPDELTGNQVAHAVGVDAHSVCMLVDRGLLPGRLLPGTDRTIRIVKPIAFYRWATGPLKWPYFLQCVDEDARLGGAKTGHIPHQGLASAAAEGAVGRLLAEHGRGREAVGLHNGGDQRGWNPHWA